MTQGNNRCSNTMKRGEKSDSIPSDLLMEIFLRLPVKSIGRFRCVSKLWGSMFHSPDFTELFLTRSLARPRLLFAVERDGEWLFYSSPQPQNLYEKSSLVVAADFHTKFSEQISLFTYSYASDDLIDFSKIRTSKEEVPLICNPLTGQFEILPKLSAESKSSLGFDPIDKQFKILLTNNIVYNETVHRILTLATEKERWQGPIIHYPSVIGEGICIDGVLYYLALRSDNTNEIVCYDIRSEKFKFLDAEFFCNPNATKLIKYKGKLGGIELIDDGDDYYDYDHYDDEDQDDEDNDDDDYDDDDDVIELSIWVLEDVEKQEWSKCVYTLPENKFIDRCNISVAGITATGEIVLSEWFIITSKPFYVFYFSPERNNLLSVEIQGFGANLKDGCEVYTFVDYVEELNFIDAKQLKTTISVNINSKEEDDATRRSLE